MKIWLNQSELWKLLRLKYAMRTTPTNFGSNAASPLQCRWSGEVVEWRKSSATSSACNILSYLPECHSGELASVLFVYRSVRKCGLFFKSVGASIDILAAAEDSYVCVSVFSAATNSRLPRALDSATRASWEPATAQPFASVSTAHRPCPTPILLGLALTHPVLWLLSSPSLPLSSISNCKIRLSGP